MEDCDIIFAGGGLASGIAALRLAKVKPDLRVVIMEASDRIGGDHIWSSFDGDMSAAQRTWTTPLYAKSWPGYDVRFPQYDRTFALGYASARSALLDKAVRAAIPAERLITNSRVESLEPDSVTLADGRRMTARAVIDGRGHAKTGALDLAWQKFVGIEIETDTPHGLSRPIIMDGRVDQIDGYRFIYVLPWDERRLLVEDTYYSSDAHLDEDAVKARIRDYAKAAGWGAYREIRTERGVLPLALDGDIDALWDETSGIARIGLRAGLFHPVTGYSFPDAVKTADLLASLPRFDIDLVYSALRSHATRAWIERRYYRLLSRMMFQAAEPDQRYRVLEHFYTKPEATVSRFYAAASSRADKFRILSGAPPVPIGRALKAVFGK